LITQRNQVETDAGERLRPASNEQVSWPLRQKTVPLGRPSRTQSEQKLK
jgi:hypothetical protein